MGLKREFREHVKDEERIWEEIRQDIKENTCQFRDGFVIKTLQNYNKIQNGRLDEISDKIGDNSCTLNTILTIAETRKNMWKEVALVASSVVAGCGTIAGIIFGIVQWIN